MTPTAEQLAVIDAARDTADNLLVSALAGAAKTTTLELIAHEIDKPMLCLAFNKRIANEMQRRLPPHCTARTLNSLGHTAWGETIGKRLRIDTRKNYDLFTSLIDGLSAQDKGEIYKDFADTLHMIAFGKTCGWVPDSWKKKSRRLMSDDDIFNHFEVEPTPLQWDIIRQVSHESLELAHQGLCDYDDQLLCPTVFTSLLPRYPLVLVDEAQDLSALNHQLLQKLVRQRLIAVGDECQCHPPGTLIQTTGGPTVPIEKLCLGEQVTSYYTRKSVFKGLHTQGRKVLDVHESHFEGELIKVVCREKEVKVTPNHRCLVRIPKTSNYALYLMKRGLQYRIGICKLSYQSGSGVAVRARQEGAEAAWILQTFLSKEIAHVFEEAYSGLFGLPQLLFNYPTAGNAQLQSNLNTAWEMIGSNHDRALAILKHFRREYAFPVWTNEETKHWGTKTFITEACNLLPEMQMCILPNAKGLGADKGGKWEDISIEYEQYSGPVYGITVEPTEGGRRLYVANGIVVHNSIYGFRGAHQDSMNVLKAGFSMTELRLSITFRCPQSVVREARWRAPHMAWPDWAEEGRVERLSSWNVDDLPEEAAIICRNNAPLFSMAIRLLKNGRYPQIVGGDIGRHLGRLLKKLGPLTMTKAEALDASKRWEEERSAKARDLNKVRDQAACMRIFIEQGATLADAIAYVEHLLSRSGPIQLTTGHKAKGLEFDHVFFLDQHLVRDSQQDKNLRYVIQTRAKQTLTYIDSEGFEDGGENDI